MQQRRDREEQLINVLAKEEEHSLNHSNSSSHHRAQQTSHHSSQFSSQNLHADDEIPEKSALNPGSSTEQGGKTVTFAGLAATASSSADGGSNSWDMVKAEMKLLSKNKDYILLFLFFSVGVGFFNTILTLLNQIVEPYGYSNDDAGTFGAVFVFAGLFGAGVFGKVMENTKAYRPLLQLGIALCVLSTCLLLAMLYSNNFWPLTVAFAVLGNSPSLLPPFLLITNPHRRCVNRFLCASATANYDGELCRMYLSSLRGGCHGFPSIWF